MASFSIIEAKITTSFRERPISCAFFSSGEKTA